MTSIAWDIWRAEHASQDAIARRQRDRLAALVDHARSASPFYRRLYRDVPETPADLLTNLRELPPVGKRELMENFDDWVTDPHITLAGLKADLLDDPSRVGGFYRGQYLVLTTSGTTGEPAVLVHDRTSWLVANLLARIRERRTMVTAAETRAFLHRGLRAAALIADGDHFAGVVLTETVRRRSPTIARRVRVFSVLRPLPDLVADLNEFQPTMLYGYPSAMLQLAAEQKAGRLRIRPILAVASGESLAATGAAEIEAALGCRATVRYLASEALALTSRCRQGQFHVNADGYIVEPVDRTFQPVPAGELSHTVLVTNLANRVQPLIRYNLGDRVQMIPGPCVCGSPFPALRVEGRSGDVLTFAAADGRTVMVLPLALGTVIEETAGVRRFQAIRTGMRQLTVRLELYPEATTAAVRTAAQERLGAFFAAQGADGVEVRFADEPPRPDRSGKFREVWSA
ncbi:phenylacetate--CoA ligase [Arthrobacter humicola]|uniref:Phenylacetate--CoA ligase n=1 Tax=Arthrobacter humicola TaxID=409291 RepID=A0ABN2YXP6_9MICC